MCTRRNKIAVLIAIGFFCCHEIILPAIAKASIREVFRKASHYITHGAIACVLGPSDYICDTAREVGKWTVDMWSSGKYLASTALWSPNSKTRAEINLKRIAIERVMQPLRALLSENLDREIKRLPRNQQKLWRQFEAKLEVLEDEKKKVDDKLEEMRTATIARQSEGPVLIEQQNAYELNEKIEWLRNAMDEVLPEGRRVRKQLKDYELHLSDAWEELPLISENDSWRNIDSFADEFIDASQKLNKLGKNAENFSALGKLHNELLEITEKILLQNLKTEKNLADARKASRFSSAQILGTYIVIQFAAVLTITRFVYMIKGHEVSDTFPEYDLAFLAVSLAAVLAYCSVYFKSVAVTALVDQVIFRPKIQFFLRRLASAGIINEAEKFSRVEKDVWTDFFETNSICGEIFSKTEENSQP